VVHKKQLSTEHITLYYMSLTAVKISSIYTAILIVFLSNERLWFNYLLHVQETAQPSIAGVCIIYSR